MNPKPAPHSRKFLFRLSRIVAGAGICIGAGFAAAAHADWALNLPRGVTEISRDVYAMHMFVLYICAVIGVIVFGAMGYSIVKHRKSQGAVPAKFHDNLWAEIIWTVIPFAILVAMAIPAAKTLLVMEDSGNADLNIKITGHQWKWEYEYLESGLRFFSNLSESSRKAAAPGAGVDVHTVPNYLLEVDRPLVLPVDKKIRFLLTSNDVLHAWWVPDFAVKKDAIPGFINQMWTRIDAPGTYRGQCAELCGRDHGYMPVVVEAVSAATFDEWLEGEIAAAKAEAESADREWGMQELMQRGETVYQNNCAACHQADGRGITGVFPALAGSEKLLNDRQAHIQSVLHGVPGTAMQAFGAQLSDADLAGVITYERNAWGNDAGDVVQPAEIRDAR